MCLPGLNPIPLFALAPEPSPQGKGLSECNATKPENFLFGTQLQQTVNCSLHEIDRVGASVNLGQNICDSAGLQYFSDARTRFNTSAWSCRNEDDFARAVFADHPMRNGVPAHGDFLLPLDVALALLDRLFDRRWHFVGFAVTIGDLTLPIADHNKRIEAKPPSTFHNAGRSADLHDEI